MTPLGSWCPNWILKWINLPQYLKPLEIICKVPHKSHHFVPVVCISIAILCGHACRKRFRLACFSWIQHCTENRFHNNLTGLHLIVFKTHGTILIALMSSIPRAFPKLGFILKRIGGIQCLERWLSSKVAPESLLNTSLPCVQHSIDGRATVVGRITIWSSVEIQCVGANSPQELIVWWLIGDWTASRTDSMSCIKSIGNWSTLNELTGSPCKNLYTSPPVFLHCCRKNIPPFLCAKPWSIFPPLISWMSFRCVYLAWNWKHF